MFYIEPRLVGERPNPCGVGIPWLTFPTEVSLHLVKHEDSCETLLPTVLVNILIHAETGGSAPGGALLLGFIYGWW